MSDDSKVKRPDQQTVGGQLTSKAGTRIEFASRNVTSGTEEMDRSFLESGSRKFRGNWESPAEDEEHSTPDEETSSKSELSAKVENEESSSGTELSSEEQRSFFGQRTFFEKMDQEETESLPVDVKMDGEPSLDSRCLREWGSRVSGRSVVKDRNVSWVERIRVRGLSWMRIL